MILRFILFIAFCYFIYIGIRYFFHPKRKLEAAVESGAFYFYDDEKNVRHNFLMTYKGCLFEGEKYLGTTKNAFDVVSIFIWPHKTEKLQGFTYDDFTFMEAQIKSVYPNAKLDWKKPIQDFLSSKNKRWDDLLDSTK